MPGFTFTSNAATVAHTLNDLQGGLPIFAQQVTVDTANRIAAKARDFAHVGHDPTYPAGRPHTKDTIGVQPVNQFVSAVVANWGAAFEEARGGEHAFLSRAVDAVQSDVANSAEALLRERMPG